jgi:hypothetical protein
VEKREEQSHVRVTYHVRVTCKDTTSRAAPNTRGVLVPAKFGVTCSGVGARQRGALLPEPIPKIEYDRAVRRLLVPIWRDVEVDSYYEHEDNTGKSPN